MLTAEMKQLISDHSAGSVATVNDDGTPSVSPKATFIIVDDTTIAFGNIRSPGTVDNLKDRPAVEVSFLDVILRRAVRVTGTGAFVRKADADAVMAGRFREKYGDFVDRMHGFVVISISAAEYILSPAYDRGETEDTLRETFRAHYSSL